MTDVPSDPIAPAVAVLPPSASDADLQRLRKRHRRDLRLARAEGLLQGVASMLRPGDVVIDGGAQWGDVSEPLAATGATVHAFEPDPQNLDRLRNRLQNLDNVQIHAAALGLAPGRARLARLANWQDDPKRALSKSTMLDDHPQMQGAEVVEVAVTDLVAFLSDLIARHGEVALVKLDIEGAELALLEAMLAARLFDHIRLTLVETHERLFPALQSRYAALRAAVAERYPQTRVNLDWI